MDSPAFGQTGPGPCLYSLAINCRHRGPLSKWKELETADGIVCATVGGGLGQRRVWKGCGKTQEHGAGSLHSSVDESDNNIERRSGNTPMARAPSVFFCVTFSNSLNRSSHRNRCFCQRSAQDRSVGRLSNTMLCIDGCSSPPRFMPTDGFYADGPGCSSFG